MPSEPHVTRSIRDLCSSLFIEKGALFSVQQVHGSNVVAVDANCQASQIAQIQADALITNCSGLALGVKVADCCAVLMHDAVSNVVAAVHSGWRGTHNRVVQATIAKMAQVYGTNAGHVTAWLSPCASAEQYQVGSDVAELFPRSSVPLTYGKWLYNNRGELEMQLREAGVCKITVDPRCSIVDTRFHSYRRDGQHSGRSLAFIMLAIPDRTKVA